MAQYCVNKNEQSNGDHEVHNLDVGCPHVPAPTNRIPLGNHAGCRTAVDKAKEYYRQSNGCYYCATACHTS